MHASRSDGGAPNVERRPPVKATKRILHPTDFSPASEPAFEYALESARRDGATLVVAYVVEPISAHADESFAVWRPQLEEAADATARKELEARLARAKAVDVPAADLLLHGWPPEQIVKAAVSEGADVIVMGTHGRTGLRRLMLGSVAQQVVALAPCPVVTIRAQR
jgi:nucleotide-binding universal stress UspA family protein